MVFSSIFKLEDKKTCHCFRRNR